MSYVHRGYYTTMDSLLAHVEQSWRTCPHESCGRIHLREPAHSKEWAKGLSGSPPGLELPQRSLGGVFQGDPLLAQSVPYLVCQGKLLGLA